MIYFLILGFSGIIFSSLLIYFRKHFFLALEATLALANAVLSNEDETVKQKKLVVALKAMLISLAITIGLICVIVVLTCLPVYIFKLIKNVATQELDLGSIWVIVSFSIGTIIPFLIKRKKPIEDYSEASILFHKLILNNYNLSKMLFSFDRKFKKGEKIQDKNTFLIVSGLARAGTTSLTDQLFKAGAFSSLDYSNMPLLLAPNLWKKMYNPKKTDLKERKHGDKMLFGLNTIEALEEYFFKVFLNDSFISDAYLEKHEITDNVYTNYIKYQSLIRQDNESTYLSKNNNIILRYESLRKLNKSFKIIFLFRKPVEHAYSLLNQHQRFSEFQNEDEFMQTYLNWLGHHEFGQNQKVFKFNNEELLIPYDKSTLDYWLSVWLNYYNYLTNMEDKDYMLIEYEDYLNKPKEVLQYIEGEMNMTFNFSNIIPFTNTREIDTTNCNPKLLETTDAIYQKLKFRKLKY
ncbi:sulfotransferase domain-containing protein [Xanthomarina spongicola]|uniref:Sulfotransferase domain-containing protein n=1 Tax=Xanthomarina spongicola TaxID=570520 RepID=A0A316DRC2_9FLAO|nr:sulfotransferase domain-containing protein [Xanthomarina spongicola]PWK20386.1 sulfotransferase domain-containing protein [Xanthomarina spongicola]